MEVKNDETQDVTDELALQAIKCPVCGNENSTTEIFCKFCGNRITNNEIKVDESPKKKREKFDLIAFFKAMVVFFKQAKIACIAFGVLILIVILLVGATKMISSLSKKSVLVYAKQDELCELSGRRPFEITDELYADKEAGFPFVVASKDGKYLFYPENIDGSNFELKYRRVGRAKDDGVKIDSDVMYYEVLSDNRVVYKKGDEDAKLYISDLNDKDKIASDVISFWMSEDEKQIMWLTIDGKLCLRDLGLRKDREKIDSSVGFVMHVSDDLNEVYYVKDNEVYVSLSGKEGKKVTDEFEQYGFLENEGKTMFMYTVSDFDESLGIDFIVNDEFAEADKDMKEPVEADYQVKPKIKSILDLFTVQGRATTTDESYYTDLEKYKEKLERDKVREEISGLLTVTSAEIYAYTSDKKDKEKLYAGPIIDSLFYGELLAYTVIDTDNVEKVSFEGLLTMSKEEKVEAIYSALSKSVKLKLYNGKTTSDILLYQDDTASNLELGSADEDANILYLTAKESAEGDTFTLYKTDYLKNDGIVSRVASDVEYFELCNKGKVYYISDTDKNKCGDLYENDKKLASDVAAFSVMSNEDGSIISFLVDIKEKGDGILYTYDGKVNKIAEDVYEYRINDKGEIAYIQDYNFKRGRGELYLSNGKKIRRVDDDVRNIVCF